MHNTHHSYFSQMQGLGYPRLGTSSNNKFYILIDGKGVQCTRVHAVVYVCWSQNKRKCIRSLLLITVCCRKAPAANVQLVTAGDRCWCEGAQRQLELWQLLPCHPVLPLLQQVQGHRYNGKHSLLNFSIITSDNKFSKLKGQCQTSFSMNLRCCLSEVFTRFYTHIRFHIFVSHTKVLWWPLHSTEWRGCHILHLNLNLQSPEYMSY